MHIRWILLLHQGFETFLLLPLVERDHLTVHHRNHPVDKLTLYGQSGGQQRQGHHHGHYRSKAAFCERAFQKVCPMLKKKLIRRSVWVCSWPGVRMEKIVGFKL